MRVSLRITVRLDADERPVLSGRTTYSDLPATVLAEELEVSLFAEGGTSIRVKGWRWSSTTGAGKRWTELHAVELIHLPAAVQSAVHALSVNREQV